MNKASRKVQLTYLTLLLKTLANLTGYYDALLFFILLYACEVNIVFTKPS
jgi:hypothetical protein